MFGKTATLLFSVMIAVEETKDSLVHYSSYEFAQIQNVVLDDYGISFVINSVIWLYISRLLKHTDTIKSATENVVAGVLG